MIQTLSRNPVRAARLVLAAALAAVVAAALLMSLSAPAAQAAPPAAMPTGPMVIEIHKYEQPDTLGQPASGLEITDPALLPQTPPVAGAMFSATRVPGIDLTTNAGQRAAGALTAAEAAQRIADAGALPEASDSTDGAGNATLQLAGSGLYYVQETVTPGGFIAAAPFVVALPLTNPDTRDSWLTTVHVYPKNERVGIRLGVTDQDAVSLGDLVRWRATADVPVQPSNSYVIRNKIDSRLQQVDGAGGITVALSCACAPLVSGTDYSVTLDPVSGEYVIELTAAGRTRLAAAAAAHPGVTVLIDYDTVVLAQGALQSEAVLVIDGSVAADDAAETQWGPLEIVVHERGNPNHKIAGARFQVYLTEADARAGTNPIAVDGVHEWTSDAQGLILINGLRFSDFVNGLNIELGDPQYRTYFVMITHIPEGYKGVKTPIGLSVTSTTEAQVAVVELWHSVDPGGLPITGGQMAGAGMLLALVLGGSGFALLATRKRRGDEAREGA